MMKAFVIALLAIFVIVLETFILQWLLGLFGWHFGFFTTMCVLFAVDFLVRAIFGRKK